MRGNFLRCNRSQHPVVVVQHLDFLEGMYLFNDDTPWYLVSIREFGGDYGVAAAKPDHIREVARGLVGTKAPVGVPILCDRSLGINCMLI